MKPERIGLEENSEYLAILEEAFHAAPRVDLAWDCVREGRAGTVYANDRSRPTAFRIDLGPFHYFGGDPAAPGARRLLETLPDYALLMPSAPGWEDTYTQLFKVGNYRAHLLCPSEVMT